MKNCKEQTADVTSRACRTELKRPDHFAAIAQALPSKKFGERAAAAWRMPRARSSSCSTGVIIACATSTGLLIACATHGTSHAWSSTRRNVMRNISRVAAHVAAMVPLVLAVNGCTSGSDYTTTTTSTTTTGPRTVMYPEGKYKLYGDGTNVPQYWVWVPAGAPTDPTP